MGRTWETLARKETERKASDTIARVLTGDDVQVSIFRFVVGMLGMFAAVVVNHTLVLNQLVFLAESNVTVSVKLRHMPGEVFNVNGFTCLTADGDGSFKVDIWWRLWLFGIVQVVVV